MATDAQPPGPRSLPKLPLGLMAVGSEMAGFTVVGVVLDLYVFGSLPWLTIGLTLLGVAVAFAHLYRFAKTYGQPPARKPGGP